MSVGILSKKQNLQKLNEWLQGTKKPTRTQLEAFANYTHTPFGYLLLSEPPPEQPLPIPHFRTVKDDRPPKYSINFEDTIGIIEQRQGWVHDYFKDLGVEPLAFVESVDMDDDPVVSADKMRVSLGLAQDWIDDHTTWETAFKYLRAQMEDAGIFLSVSGMVQHNPHRRLDPMEFRGFVFADDYTPFVFINSADAKGAQMFTLAHELAHVLIGDSASFDLQLLSSDSNERLEIVCNSMASEFLVPTKKLLSHWDMFAESPDGVYDAISRYFKVSSIVAARRALDAGCISYGEFYQFYRRYMQQALNRKKPKSEQRGGPPFARMAITRIGKRFMQAVVTAVRERRLLYTDAYHLTGLQSETFDDVANIIGVDMDIRQ